ncbi:MAG TPA: hypothetical protein HPP41_03415 [Deltaproteobacteria bacterium]|nr:hypothetical protein [Deltaproteobacteria bacterium]
MKEGKCGPNNATSCFDRTLSPTDGLDILEIIDETERAVFVQLGGEHDFDNIWMPRSVIVGGAKLHKGDNVSAILVEEWFLENEELI